MKTTYIPHVVIGIAIAAIVVGLYTIGIPSKARLYRIDNERLEDLASIRNVINDYWHEHEELPNSLTALDRPPFDDYFYPEFPVDPETGDSYEYKLGEGEAYELCAIFALGSEGNEKAGSFSYGYGFDRRSDMIWDHPAGYHCFSLRVDEGPRPEKGVFIEEEVEMPAQ